MAFAAALGLRVAHRVVTRPGAAGLMEALGSLDDADVVNLRTPVDPGMRRVLLGGSDAVLANSGHEPFGLVGLETMGVGGVACTGSTGEDYAVPGQNALVLETNDPREFLGLFVELRSEPGKERALRREGRATAARYLWRRVLAGNLLPRLRALSGLAWRPPEPSTQVA